MEENGEVEDVTVPLKAKAIKITNVLDPYSMRMYEIKDYNEKIDAVCKKLMSLQQKGEFEKWKISRKPEFGDYVVISENWNADIDLPAFWCRGFICSDQPIELIYTVLLIDYGICIDLWNDGFLIIPKSLVCEPSVTRTISVSNILPLCIRREGSIGKDKDETKQWLQLISDNWLPDAIQLTKDLITAANEIFFDYFYTDTNDIQFGELFLGLEHEVIRLSDALVASFFAVRMDKNFLNCTRKPDSLEQCTVDGKIVYCFSSGNKVVKGISPRRPIERNGSGKRIIEHERQKALVFTKVPCGFLTSVSEAKFPTKIHMAWNDMTRSSRPKTIQAYIWPAIKKGLDIVAIGAKNCGKTLGVTTAVCGHVAACKNIAKGKEPLAVIFCATSSNVLKVYAFCLELLREYNNIKVVPAINGKPDRSLAAEMYNGCQILITTANFLARFQKRNKDFFTWKKLQYFVIDDADIILDKYSSSVNRFLKQILCKNGLDGVRDLQMILTGRHWTSLLNRYGPILKSPYICFTSFLEAAIFKSMRPYLLVMYSLRKPNVLLDLMKDREYKKMRTVVVCANAKEAMELSPLFLLNKIDMLLVHEETRTDAIEGIKSCWHAAVRGSYPVLITTDETLSDLNITNADSLIHYSISLTHKTRFNFRHSVLIDDLSKRVSGAKVTIFADETNDIQFQSIVGMMMRVNLKLSSTMKDDIQRMAIAFEKKKTNRSICNKLKALGFCPEQNSCRFRHCILRETDDPLTNIRISDQVKIMVICLHDASHMSARIISYINSKTQEEILFPNTDYVDLYAKMRKFYCDEENRRMCRSINVGDVCSFEETLDDFKRVQIIHVEEQQDADEPKFVNVRCIDNGIVTEEVKPFKLLQIPDELRELPCHAVDVFLSNVAPQDDEYDWDVTATNVVRNWFKDNVDERSYVIGTVQLHVNDTIWVDTLEVGTTIVGYPDLMSSSLKQELFKHGLAVENTEHIEKLRNLCIDASYKFVNSRDISSSIDSDNPYRDAI